jgi:hypothetical protein
MKSKDYEICQYLMISYYIQGVVKNRVDFTHFVMHDVYKPICGVGLCALLLSWSEHCRESGSYQAATCTVVTFMNNIDPELT